jgi:ABC-type multidrug transport system fused ATPase/permease subunit
MNRVRTGLRQLRMLCGDRTGPAAALVVASILAGLAEASVLALLAEVAAAMVQGAHKLSTDIGPARLDMSLGTALALAIALAFARLLLGLVIARLPARIAADVQARWRRELFDAFAGASWAVQSRDREGHLQELMTNQVNQAMQAALQVVASLSGGAIFLALVAAAFVLNPLLALIIFVTAFCLFWLMRPISRLGRSAAKDLSQTSMNYAAELSEMVRLSEDAHVFGAGNAYRKRMGDWIETGRRDYFRYQWTGGLVRNIYQSLVMVLIVLGLTGLYLASASNVAALGAVVLMLVRATSYAQQFQGGFHALNQVLPYTERLEAATQRYRASAPPSGNLSVPPIESITFDDVSFAYRPDRKALRGVSFNVSAGEAIGIVGPSGAGKSTLIQLLLQLREPDDGRYLINGLPAGSLRQSDWHQTVAYVAQESRVMHGTVADNIRFFRELDDAAVQRAASLAHIHDEIMQLPSGYDPVISQVGDAVSGGQRQRICIARALAGEPQVLVLDEPTSALDMASEVAVRAALQELQGQITMFVAAHRLSALRNCNRVLVLAHGSVEAFASADELERNNAFYQVASALTRGS